MTGLQAPFVLGLLFILCLHTYMATSRAWDNQCRNREGHQTWEHSVMNLSYFVQPFPDPRIFQHNEMDDCPTFNQLITYDRLSAQNLSLCPWTTEIDHDFDRFPHNMTFARCSCKRCVTWDETGPGHECKAHYHTFKVIRRECHNGNYRYFYTTEHLPIACVCSHESMHIVDSTD